MLCLEDPQVSHSIEFGHFPLMCPFSRHLKQILLLLTKVFFSSSVFLANARHFKVEWELFSQHKQDIPPDTLLFSGGGVAALVDVLLALDDC